MALQITGLSETYPNGVRALKDLSLVTLTVQARKVQADGNGVETAMLIDRIADDNMIDVTEM
jgi:hypothetical protein